MKCYIIKENGIILEADENGVIKGDESKKTSVKKDNTSEVTSTTVKDFITQNLSAAFENNSTIVKVDGLFSNQLIEVKKDIEEFKKNNNTASFDCVIQCTSSGLSNLGEAKSKTFRQLSFERSTNIKNILIKNKDLFPDFLSEKNIILIPSDNSGTNLPDETFSVKIKNKDFILNTDSTLGFRSPYQDITDHKNSTDTVGVSYNYHLGNEITKTGNTSDGRPNQNFNSLGKEKSPIEIHRWYNTKDFTPPGIIIKDNNSFNLAISAINSAANNFDKVIINVIQGTDKTLLSNLLKNIAGSISKYYKPFITTYIKYEYNATTETTKKEVVESSTNKINIKRNNLVNVYLKTNCVNGPCDVSI